MPKIDVDNNTLDVMIAALVYVRDHHPDKLTRDNANAALEFLNDEIG